MTFYEFRVQFVPTIEGPWGRDLAPTPKDFAKFVETTLNEDTPDFARQGWEPWNVIPTHGYTGFMIIYRRPRQ